MKLTLYAIQAIFLMSMCSSPLLRGMDATLVAKEIDQLKSQIYDIGQRVDAAVEQIKVWYPYCRYAVIVVGKSLEGKSTLISFLAGKQLTVFKENMTHKVKFVEPDACWPISMAHHALSGTSTPAYWYDEAHKTVWWDCPGFGDSSPVCDIRNAYVLIKLLKSFPSYKLLLAASQEGLTKTADSFQASVKYLGHMFPRIISELGDHICLGVLRAEPGVISDEVRATIEKEILQALRDSGDSDKLKVSLLQSIVEKSSIVLFPKATVNGPFLNDEKGGKIRTDFFAAVEKLKPLVGLQPERPILSDSAKVIASEIARSVLSAIESSLVQIADLLVDYCDKEISRKGDPDELRNNFRKLKSELTKYIEGLPNFDQSENKIFCFLEEFLPEQDVLAGLIVYMGHLSFLDPVNCLGIQNIFRVKFENVTKLLEKLSSEPDYKIFDKSLTILTIKSVFIGLSDLNDYIREYSSEEMKIKKIRIFASHTLFLDQDLVLPGISVILIAPNWIVKPFGCTIDLSGENGRSGENGAQDGADGESGFPGGHGGHFYGEASMCDGPERLIIRSNGGNGGNGGNGKDGADGLDGGDGSLVIPSLNELNSQEILLELLENNHAELTETLKGRRLYGRSGIDNSGTIAHLLRVLWAKTGRAFRSQKVCLEYTRCCFDNTGTPGQPGREGGKGGASGKGGEAGCVREKGIIITERKHEQGKDGNPGNAGVGGQGGRGGRNAEGEVWENVSYKPWYGLHHKSDFVGVQSSPPSVRLFGCCANLDAQMELVVDPERDKIVVTAPRHLEERSKDGDSGATPNERAQAQPSHPSIDAINEEGESEAYNFFIVAQRRSWEAGNIPHEKIIKGFPRKN